MNPTNETQTEAPALWAALFAFQNEVEAIVKDAENPHYHSSYAKREDILAVIKPLLAKNGLLLIQAAVPSPQAASAETDYLALQTTIVHAATGQMISSTAVSPLDRSNPQGYGSALTYLSRYSMVALFVLPLEDDDGNGASVRPTTKPPVKAKTAPKATTTPAAAKTNTAATSTATSGSTSSGSNPAGSPPASEPVVAGAGTTTAEAPTTASTKPTTTGRKLWGAK